MSLKINASTKCLVERLCDLKICAVSVLSYIGSTCAPDKATLKAEAHAPQCTTAGPYNAISTSLSGVGSVCGLGPDLVGIHSISASRPAIELPRVRTRSTKDLQRSRLPERLILLLSLRSVPTGKRTFLLPPWLVHRGCFQYGMSSGPQ